MFTVRPEDSIKIKIMKRTIKALDHHHTLEGINSFIALWWGLLTLVFDSFWVIYPIARLLSYHTGGHPELISWLLLLSGIGSYVSNSFNISWMRSSTSLIILGCWCLLTITYSFASPIYTPGLAVYSALAMFKFVSYLNSQLRSEFFKIKEKRERGI